MTIDGDGIKSKSLRSVLLYTCLYCNRVDVYEGVVNRQDESMPLIIITLIRTELVRLSISWLI